MQILDKGKKLLFLLLAGLWGGHFIDAESQKAQNLKIFIDLVLAYYCVYHFMLKV